MADPAAPRRAALYVDFDNVFLALARWDERAAYAFGERPDAWLAWLEGRDADGRPTERRTLVRRCYLNPAGLFDFPMGRAVARYRAARDLRNRTYFSEFRTAFVAAGFDVVDCPPITFLKNTADMKMALDIREALDHSTRFDEFVLLSGDSDFLPALARLRAHDRRITILAQNTAKAAYLAAADTVFALTDFAHDALAETPIAAFEVEAPPRERTLPPPRPVEPPARAPDHAGLRTAALEWLRNAIAASPDGALRLTEVGQHLARALPALRQTGYAGAGSLGTLIEEANDRRLALSGPASRRWVYDAERGPPPGDLPPGVEEQPPLAEGPVGPQQAPPDQAGTPAAAGESAAEAAPLPPEPAAAAVPGPAPEPPPEPEPTPGPEQPPQPTPQPTPQPLAEPPPPPEPPTEALMAEAALLVRDILWGGRDAKGLPHDLPAFSPSEIAFLLRGLAARQPLEAADLPPLAPLLAAEAAGQGLLVSPREVLALQRWLVRGYARLGEAPGQDAALRLARNLTATLVNAVQAAGERLSEPEKEALRAWAQSGLNGAG